MAIWRSVLFKDPEAEKLADLSGVETDLIATEQICTMFLEEYAKEQPNWALLEPLCAAALVRYGRTVNSGVRSGVPKALMESLELDLQESHNFFKDLRDKWIAHSINSFEENEVVLWLLPPERGPHEVMEVSVRQRRVHALGPDAMARLRLLCQELRASLEKLISTERGVVLEAARGKPVKELYDLPYSESEERGPNVHRLSRKRK